MEWRGNEQNINQYYQELNTFSSVSQSQLVLVLGNASRFTSERCATTTNENWTPFENRINDNDGEREYRRRRWCQQQPFNNNDSVALVCTFAAFECDLKIDRMISNVRVARLTALFFDVAHCWQPWRQTATALRYTNKTNSFHFKF